ncbi:hypothetical protein HYX10_00700 [Candidatus Woesearchaeota archaeon]|nr:hypothetical protein [Candidatus Woesearchaeota archaeon]
MRNAQSANETAMIIAVMTLFLIAFLSVMSDRFIIVSDGRTRQSAEDLADAVEAELVLAANAQDGYSRIFSTPGAIDGRQYYIVFYNTSSTGADFTQLVIGVNVTGGEYQAVRILPANLKGNINPASDIFISKLDGVVNATPPLS